MGVSALTLKQQECIATSSPAEMLSIECKRRARIENVRKRLGRSLAGGPQTVRFARSIVIEQWEFVAGFGEPNWGRCMYHCGPFYFPDGAFEWSHTNRSPTHNGYRHPKLYKLETGLEMRLNTSVNHRGRENCRCFYLAYRICPRIEICLPLAQDLNDCR
jgi:hypothetical protein